MKKILALVNARNKEFYRDRMMLMWTFLFPFLVLLGFAYGYSGREEPVLKLGLHPAAALQAPELKELASIPQLQLVPYDDLGHAQGRVARHQLDLLLALRPGEGATYWMNPDSAKAGLAERLVRDALPEGAPLAKLELPGKKLRYVDWLVPGMIGMNLMFGALFGVGYTIVRYRKNGVLKRLRATPITAFEFLCAQVASRTLLLLATTLLTVLGAMALVGFRPAGSWVDLAVFVSVACGSLIALGMLVAARISSEEVADGMLNLMTWPMMFLSGVWFSLEGASPWVLAISRALPLTHIVEGMRAILIEGASLSSLLPRMAALGGAGLLLLAVGSALFRWR